VASVPSVSSPSVKVVQGHYAEMGLPGGPWGGTAALKFDRVYSIGMFEAVRCCNYDLYFHAVKRVLVDGGRFVLHTITDNEVPRNGCTRRNQDSFTSVRIFPGGQIPTTESVLAAAARSGLRLVHLETFAGAHYARTLAEWRTRLDAAAPVLIGRGYPPSTIRAYQYYMAQCQAAFWEDHMQLSHFVFDWNVRWDESHSGRDVYTSLCSRRET
jgi:cyclopropane-fatty-acyl-phospholipid synthase